MSPGEQRNTPSPPHAAPRTRQSQPGGLGLLGTRCSVSSAWRSELPWQDNLLIELLQFRLLKQIALTLTVLCGRASCCLWALGRDIPHAQPIALLVLPWHVLSCHSRACSVPVCATVLLLRTKASTSLGISFVTKHCNAPFNFLLLTSLSSLIFVSGESWRIKWCLPGLFCDLRFSSRRLGLLGTSHLSGKEMSYRKCSSCRHSTVVGPVQLRPTAAHRDKSYKQRFAGNRKLSPQLGCAQNNALLSNEAPK